MTYRLQEIPMTLSHLPGRSFCKPFKCGDFYPCDAMLARYLLSQCVRPSQIGVVAKRLNVGSRKQRFTIFLYLLKNFTVELKCKLKTKLINDNSHNHKISRRCTNRYLQCEHGTVQSVQTVCSRTIVSRPILKRQISTLH